MSLKEKLFYPTVVVFEYFGESSEFSKIAFLSINLFFTAIGAFTNNPFLVFLGLMCVDAGLWLISGRDKGIQKKKAKKMKELREEI